MQMPAASLRPWFTLRLFIAIGCAAISIDSLIAATFVVPPDRELVRQATAIVIASPIASRTQLRHERTVETVTTFSIEEVLKGPIGTDSLEVHEPGGVYGKRVTSVPGVPRFTDGERYLLFLIRTDEGIWRVLNLVLGKFRFATDILGHAVAMRDSRDIAGWDPDGKPHREQNRASEPFLAFVRAASAGGPAREDYMIPEEPLVLEPALSGMNHGLRAVPLVTYTPTSYTYAYSGATGARWFTFPSAVNFYSTSANAAAVTALNNAIASWNNDAGSNVNLVNAGADASGTHNGGALTPDGQNTVAFEKNLTTEYGAPGFNCAVNSYSGTLGVGAVNNDGGTQIGPNGETFYSATEGDVEMNVGLSTCTFFINRGDFNSAVAHELGHAMGFRHSDQDRNLIPGPAGSCSGVGSLECTGGSIMTAYIPTNLSGALQPWDQHAVDAVYAPGAVSAPTGLTATVQTSTSILVSWTASAGAGSYRVYRTASSGGGWTLIASGSCSSPTATSCTDTVSANGAYAYKATAVGSSESGYSNADIATTVIWAETLTAQATTIKLSHLTELRTAVDAVHKAAGLGAVTFTDAAVSGLVVKGVHMTELRSNLDTAMAALGLTTGGWTDDPVSSSVKVKATHFNQLRTRMQ